MANEILVANSYYLNKSATDAYRSYLSAYNHGGHRLYLSFYGFMIIDADKVDEKEALQRKINNLQVRLAESDAWIRVVAHDKIHMELLYNTI